MYYNAPNRRVAAVGDDASSGAGGTLFALAVAGGVVWILLSLVKGTPRQSSRRYERVPGILGARRGFSE